MKSTYIVKAVVSVALTGCFAILSSGVAYAESGYRICARYNASRSTHDRVGLAAKIANGNGGDTCGKKLAWMKSHFPWRGIQTQWAYDSEARMVTCEYASKELGIPGDMCKRMAVNKIYKVDGASDSVNWYAN